MIALKNGAEAINIPDKWSELTPDQFIKAIILYNEMIAGNCNILDFRLRLLQKLTGYRRGKEKVDPETAENIDSNLFVLSQMLTFPLKPGYADPEIMEIFTEELQAKLKTTFPFDISDIEEIEQLAMVGDRLRWFPMLNLDFGMNPIPTLPVGKKIRTGPVFNVDDYGIISTDMIVDEYIDALEYLKLYQGTGNIGYLDKMISVLYREKRQEYSTFHNSIAGDVSILTICTKQAIEKVFEYICHTITTHPAFELLFSSVEKKAGGSFSDIIYHLSEKGLGSRTEIARWNLTDFLSAIVRDLKNNVASMRASGVDESKISTDMNIPVETLQKI